MQATRIADLPDITELPHAFNDEVQRLGGPPPKPGARSALHCSFTEEVALPAIAERLKALRCLLAIVKHGSAVRAAEAVHLSQPAVTRAILELEKHWNVPLFVRASRGMVPTTPGSRVAKRTETMFLHLTSAASEAIAAAPLASRRPVAPERFAASVSPASLRALLAVAIRGSEAKAATALGISQPAVHVSLQGLEQSLGVKLFYKSMRGTQLTHAGSALLRRVKLAMSEARAMESDIAAWRGEVRGRIAIGALPLSVSFFLPRAVDTLLRRHPNIEIHIVDGTYESLMQQLLSADVDVIVGALRTGTVHPETIQERLFEDDLVVVARTGHPCLSQPSVELQHLLNWDWVIPLPGTPASTALELAFSAHGLPTPRGSLQANSPALTQAFVTQTNRLALASRKQTLEDNQGSQLSIVPVSLSSTRRHIGTVVRSMSEPSHDLHLFLEQCRAVLDVKD